MIMSLLYNTVSETTCQTKLNKDVFAQPTYDFFLARGVVGANKREVNAYVFNNNYPPARVDAVINDLIRFGKIEKMEPTMPRGRGNPGSRWRVVSGG